MAPSEVDQESARIAALQACDVLDTAQEACFDALTQMAAEMCGTPMALVSLVDEKRQWFKSRLGFGAAETPREYSFCSTAIKTPSEAMVIEDAKDDERFRDNPLVVGPPHLRFYAGVPLVTWDGYALGTLCVLDQKPGKIDETQMRRLKALADHARAQLELRRAFHELNELNDLLSRRAGALRATNESLQAFAYSASHDLRAPLRRISMLAQDVVDDEGEELPPESRKNLERIARESTRMRDLIEDLLELGRATTLELDTGDVDLKHVAIETIKRLQTSQPERNVEFVAEGDLQARGDTSLLSIALANLLDNAWKYTRGRDPARIVLSGARAADGTLVVFVEDNGVGFDPALATGRLFTPFQRLHAKEEFVGTGVGLATVRRIIERHGGKIWAEGAPGKGATFHFTIPPSPKKTAELPEPIPARRG